MPRLLAEPHMHACAAWRLRRAMIGDQRPPPPSAGQPGVPQLSTVAHASSTRASPSGRTCGLLASDTQTHDRACSTGLPAAKVTSGLSTPTHAWEQEVYG